MIKVLRGGTITAKGRGLIIPVNAEAGKLLRKYPSNPTRNILQNESNFFIAKEVMFKKYTDRIEPFFIFKKQIVLPNRDVLYLTKSNLDYIKKTIIGYLK